MRALMLYGVSGFFSRIQEKLLMYEPLVLKTRRSGASPRLSLAEESKRERR
jgi:hypothetical protein